MTNVRELSPVKQAEPERRVARDLAAGDILAAGMLVTGRPTEVLHVQTYPSGSHLETLIVHRPSGRANALPATVDADREFRLATTAEIEAARERGEREKFIAGLHEFADWLKAHPEAPIERMSGYIGRARLQVDLHGGDLNADAATVAQVRDLAEKFGVKVHELDDRTDASVEIGSVSYSVIAWHKHGRPAEPKPTCVASLHVPAQFPDARCLRCGASGVVAAYEPDDPTGLTYSRADDDERTDHPADRPREVLSVSPVSPGRVPMHVGEVVDDELTGAAMTDSCVITGWGGRCTTHKARHIASGEATCGCPVYPFAGRGDSADTIVDHRQGCAEAAV